MNRQDRSIQQRAIERLMGELGPRALARLTTEQLHEHLRGELSRELQEQHGVLEADRLQSMQRDLIGLGTPGTAAFRRQSGRYSGERCRCNLVRT